MHLPSKAHGVARMQGKAMLGLAWYGRTYMFFPVAGTSVVVIIDPAFLSDTLIFSSHELKVSDLQESGSWRVKE